MLFLPSCLSNSALKGGPALIGRQSSSCRSLKIILKTWGWRLQNVSYQQCAPPCETRSLPDACRCYRRLPNRLSRSWDCGRLSEWIKVWQTNPLYKGLSFCTSPNFPLMLHTGKRGWLCYYSGESMFYIQTSVSSHWWRKPSMDTECIVRLVPISTLFSQSQSPRN